MSVLPILSISARAEDWQRMPDLPESNGGMVCYVMGEDIVVAGGTNWEGDTKRWLQKRWRFVSSSNSWKPMPALASPLAYAAGDADANSMRYFSAGGSDGKSTSGALLEWSEDKPPQRLASLPQPVTLAGAAFADGRLFVIGGAGDISDFGTVTAKCSECSISNKSVRILPDYPAGPTALVAVAAAGHQVYAFTGATWDAATKQVINRNSAFAYDLSSQMWKRIASYPFATRGVTALTLDETRVFLAGGFKDSEGFTDQSFIYDVRSNSYKPGPPLPLKGMVHLVKTREWLWVLGGEDRQRHRSAGCWRVRLSEL